MNEEIGKFLEIYDYDYFMNEALSRVPEGIDTREGSIIYDALAPGCYQLADVMMQLKFMYQAAFAHTAPDEYLDLKASERGLSRYLATKAIRLGYFEDTDGKPMSDLIGARFSTINTTQFLAFKITEATNTPGYFNLECEIEGVVGNAYVGDLLPLTHLNGLGRATLTDLITPGQDTENDESLRTRYFSSMEVSSFGGNVAQYKELIMGISGVGAVQIHSTPFGGGTVGGVIVDGEYNTVSNNFINSVQTIIDPRSEGKGQGLAPLDHKVTISTPTIRKVNVTVKIDTQPGTTIGQVQDPIVNAIDSYFHNLRSRWAEGNEFSEYFVALYRSQLMVAILQIDGVVNVSQVLLDGFEQDIIFEQSGQLQELPFAGAVVVSAS